MLDPDRSSHRHRRSSVRLGHRSPKASPSHGVGPQGSEGRSGDDALMAELRSHVGKEIGPIARPDLIKFSDALPKTRSGKIMRRILRSLASGQAVSGDTSTLEDRSVLDQLRV